MIDFQNKFPCPACVDLNPYLLPSVFPKGFDPLSTNSYSLRATQGRGEAAIPGGFCEKGRCVTEKTWADG